MTDLHSEENITSKILAGNPAKKRMARILAVQAVYAHTSTNKTNDLNTLILGVIETYPKVFGEDEKFTKADEKFMITITKGVFTKHELVDEMISKYLAAEWKLSRLGLLVQSILRTAVFELLDYPDVERGIIINEYLEIAKLFNHDGEVGFINSVLDNIAKSLDQRI